MVADIHGEDSMKQLLWTLPFLLLATANADAAIPVIDKKILTKKSKTNSTTAETAKTQKKTKKNTEGIDCSTRSGDKKSNAKEGRGSATKKNKLDQFAAPDGPDGVKKGLEDHRSKTGEVVDEIDGTSEGVKKTADIFDQIGKEIGTTTTIKGSYDQNSVIGAQNGITLNNAIMAANIFAQAWNLKNQLMALEQSQLASVTTGDTGLGEKPYQCADGTIGRGSRTKPCVSTICTPQDGAYPQGCFQSWFVTPEGRTVTYVSHPSDLIYVTGTRVDEPKAITSQFIDLTTKE
jgi:hypothetical protein